MIKLSPDHHKVTTVELATRLSRVEQNVKLIAETLARALGRQADAIVDQAIKEKVADRITRRS